MFAGLKKSVGGAVMLACGAAAGVGAGLGATAAAAQNAPVVVELFTSQGCSSCPPADEMMVELAGRDDIIALAFHVDYWDYIGWRDTFGAPQNTARQQAYARAAHATSVYTPQFIVGGVDHVIGARAMELMDRIDAQRLVDHGVQIEAAREDGQIVLQAQASGAAPMTVQLIRYSPMETVNIEHGENAGLAAEYANIVLAWDVVAEWSGVEPLTLSIEDDGSHPSVIVIQALGAGPILAAVDLG